MTTTVQQHTTFDSRPLTQLEEAIRATVALHFGPRARYITSTEGTSTRVILGGYTAGNLHHACGTITGVFDHDGNRLAQG